MNEPTKQDQEFYEKEVTPNFDFDIDDELNVIEKGGESKMEEHYPPFQWSVFPEGNKSEQYVVRADTFEALEAMRKQVLTGTGNGQATQPVQQPVQPVQPQQPTELTSVPVCPQCQSEMWDNRPKKATGEFKATSPDFKCKKCAHVIWPPKN